MSRGRTFGDIKDRVDIEGYGCWWPGLCSFCKKDRHVIRYSTRHYVCADCAEARRDVVLPAVKKRERLDRRMQKVRSEP